MIYLVAKMNLIVPQGDDFDKSFDLTDDSGAPYDTTGCKLSLVRDIIWTRKC